MALRSGHYDFGLLKTATASFCSGILIENNSITLHNLLSPDCKFSTAGKELLTGDTHCMKNLLELQPSIFEFEKEHGSMRRGLKINEKKQKTRILLMPSNATLTFRIGFILHWECGLLIHVTVVHDPWQGFLDELTASDDNRKLDQLSTTSLKKSVSASHYAWRKISDIVVDGFVPCPPDDSSINDIGNIVLRASHPSNESLANLTTSGEISSTNEVHLSLKEESVPDSSMHGVGMSSDESIFHASNICDDIEVDVDSSTDDGLLRDLKWDASSRSKSAAKSDEKSTASGTLIEKKRIRFDTTVNALLIQERCEMIPQGDLFFTQIELKASQFEFSNEVTTVQQQHKVKFEVAQKIYFCTSPDEIQEIKKEAAVSVKKGHEFDKRKKIIDKAVSGDDDKWYPGKNLPLVKLMKAHKRKQRKKKAELETANDVRRRRSSSQSVESYADVEGRISVIRCDSFGSSVRGRDPEATKYVLSVKVLCCVNLNLRKTKFMSNTNTIKVRVGNESFDCPLASHSSPVDNDNPTFLFSVSVDEAMHGSIEFILSSSALKKVTIGAFRVPFVSIKNRSDSCQPSHIIIPISKNELDYKSIGRGFYCRSSDAIPGEVEESAFLKRMYEIKQLARPQSKKKSDVTKLYVEITKVDVSGSYINDTFCED
eukprot:CAMPEP_0114454800 /NCGR_PEP_ID=MMETSP0104-20121206/2770_1 /TAXON_ID=37642 ORGANISM="Paraphysomonas imperforata, Strain PA2" /NCGR_SAMPLE_ID=MMETSP0104 /ASSEMBLY_ACC=CAM_ASM_000202 /LENGTH=656 /DNA_ID=CAMNT_0001627199 /DNA_START=114 /DNA_END=2084 /DNA_ORIENTATION=-